MPKNPTLYLESTIPSYLTARPSRDLVAAVQAGEAPEELVESRETAMKTEGIHPEQPGGEIIPYQTEDGRTRIQVRREGTVWLTIAQMAELFQVDKSGTSCHLQNVHDTGELLPGATAAKFATVRMEGDRSVQRELEYYNLDAIISVGYRVNSIRGTQFRRSLRFVGIIDVGMMKLYQP